MFGEKTLSAAVLMVTMAIWAAPGSAHASTRYIGELEGLSEVSDKHFDEFHRANAANFSQYSKIIIEPVEVLYGRDRELKKLSKRDLQGRQDYLRNALIETFGQRFEVVDQPGPGVLSLKASLTSVWFNKASLDYQKRPGMTQLSHFNSFYVGRAGFQADIRDSQTGALLGAVVDHRRGWSLDSNHKNRYTFWGDAEDFMDRWAEELPGRLQ